MDLLRILNRLLSDSMQSERRLLNLNDCVIEIQAPFVQARWGARPSTNVASFIHELLFCHQENRTASVGIKTPELKMIQRKLNY